jgi:hypothetical protein
MALDRTERRELLAVLALAFAGYGCYCVDVPYPITVRRAPICIGPKNAEEQQAIDDLKVLLSEAGVGILCGDASKNFPPMEAAVLVASGVDPLMEKDGRFIAVHPWVAVTIYEWNADSTAIVPIAHSEAPRELSPCDSGVERVGKSGYWTSERTVTVVIACGDSKYPQFLFTDPFQDIWGSSSQPNDDLRSPSLLVDGKVLAPDGQSYPVSLERVTRVTERYAISDSYGVILQNLRTSAIHEFPSTGFLSPGGTRVVDAAPDVIRTYDVSGDEPALLHAMELPESYRHWSGGRFFGDRVFGVSAMRDATICNLPILPFFEYPQLFVDLNNGQIFDVGDSVTDLSNNLRIFVTRTNPRSTP